MSTPTYTMTPNEPGWWWYEYCDCPLLLVESFDGELVFDKHASDYEVAERVSDVNTGMWYGPFSKPNFPHFPTTVEEVKAEEERQAKELAAMTPEQRECYDENLRDATERFRQMLKDWRQE